MPLREYFCDTCGYIIRQFDHSGSKPKPECLGCGEILEIFISKSTFKLRGLGWSEEGFSKDIDSAELFWAKDGKPVFPHVMNGKDPYSQKKKQEIADTIEKNLK